MAMNLYGSITEHLPIYLNENDYRYIDSVTNQLTSGQHWNRISVHSVLARHRIEVDDQQRPGWYQYARVEKLQQLRYDENFELYG